MAQGPFLRDESRMRDAGSQVFLSLRKQGILVKYAQKYISFQSQKGRILVFLFKDRNTFCFHEESGPISYHDLKGERAKTNVKERYFRFFYFSHLISAI
jgi:hypothetical protein